jgi:hypothetical protein
MAYRAPVENIAFTLKHAAPTGAIEQDSKGE